MRGELNEFISDRLPIESRESEKIFYFMKMLLASLVYHKDFLRKNLHEKSAVRYTAFTNVPVACKMLRLLLYRQHPANSEKEN